MKRLFSILLCLVMCFGCSLTAFAGGPISDIRNDENEISNTWMAIHAVPPGDLKYGVTYRIRSMASMSLWLNVNNGTDANNTPVTMRSEDEDFNKKNQKFRLISAGSYFMLGAACSTDGRVLDAYRINGELKGGCSADIWLKGDNSAQYFVITGDSNSGYLIRLASNQLYVSTRRPMAVPFSLKPIRARQTKDGTLQI